MDKFKGKKPIPQYYVIPACETVVNLSTEREKELQTVLQLISLKK